MPSEMDLLRSDAPHPGATVRPDRGASRAGPSRVAELDALRGLAALAVVVFHACGRWLPCGWAAVDLFFVLSGFLITSIVLRHAGDRGFLLSFYARRGLRIWPLYYLAVGLVALATPLLAQKPDWSSLLAQLTFTQGISEYWTGRAAPGFSIYLIHTWTLAIEEQFYLLWPALILLVGRRRVIPLALAVGLISVSARWSGWRYTLLLARSDGLALGGLLAALFERAGDDPRKTTNLARMSLVAAIGGLAATWMLGGLDFLLRIKHYGPTLLAYNVMFFGMVGLVAARAGHPALAVLRRRRLVWLGTVSYGLYLIHQILFVILGDILLARNVEGSRPAWVFVPAILMSLVLAGLSYRWIEEPILRLKSRFRYAAEGSAATSPRHISRSERHAEQPLAS